MAAATVMGESNSDTTYVALILGALFGRAESCKSIIISATDQTPSGETSKHQHSRAGTAGLTVADEQWKL